MNSLSELEADVRRSFDLLGPDPEPWFEPMAGDMMPLDTKLPPTREEKKAKARAHAKGVRKERRGERRGRGDAERGSAGRGDGGARKGR